MVIPGNRYPDCCTDKTILFLYAVSCMSSYLCSSESICQKAWVVNFVGSADVFGGVFERSLSMSKLAAD